jgi:hypothetical protein
MLSAPLDNMHSFNSRRSFGSNSPLESAFCARYLALLVSSGTSREIALGSGAQHSLSFKCLHTIAQALYMVNVIGSFVMRNRDNSLTRSLPITRVVGFSLSNDWVTSSGRSPGKLQSIQGELSPQLKTKAVVLRSVASIVSG